MSSIEQSKCILCNSSFTGWGHNPEPLASSDHECCSTCNQTRVIPYRINQITRNYETIPTN
jgi:hypothetical protein